MGTCVYMLARHRARLENDFLGKYEPSISVELPQIMKFSTLLTEAARTAINDEAQHLEVYRAAYVVEVGHDFRHHPGNSAKLRLKLTIRDDAYSMSSLPSDPSRIQPLDTTRAPLTRLFLEHPNELEQLQSPDLSLHQLIRSDQVPRSKFEQIPQHSQHCQYA